MSGKSILESLKRISHISNISVANFIIEYSIYDDTVGFKLTDDICQFMIYFDYFVEHFFLIFLKLANQFLIVQDNFIFL